jgi:hypothetical protein
MSGAGYRQRGGRSAAAGERGLHVQALRLAQHDLLHRTVGVALDLVDRK